MNENKYIYLIDLGDDITWFDSPDPSDDIDEEDVTAYIRKDIVEQMVKEAVDRVLQKRLGKPKQ